MKIGILGGTFDPIHLGHYHLARSVSKIFDLRRVFFMVSNRPPHKGKRELASSFHRFAMTEVGLLDGDGFCPSRWELDRDKPSYTIETLHHFASEYTADQFCFIAGSDSLQEIHLWKNCIELLTKYSFVFVQRPGTEVGLAELKISDPLKRKIQVVCKEESPMIGPGQSFLTDINALPISSTLIRKMIQSGQKPPSDMVSPFVLRYIKKHRLYEKY